MAGAGAGDEARPDVPEPVRAVLDAHGVPAAALRPRDKLGLRRPVRRLGAGGVVVELAAGAAGQLRLRREIWGRAWAQTVGVPTVRLLGADPDGGWLVSEWVEALPPTGAAFLDRAIDVADRIAAAPPPLPGPPPAVWRSPRSAALVRTARALAGRMPMRLWLASRAVAGGLPRVAVAHGDYYHRNVLWRDGEVRVVDWEFLGEGPRHGDLLRMWTVLPARDDRDALIDRLLGRADAAGRREIAALALFLALRLLGENLKGARADRKPEDIAHARSIQPEAAALARAHGAWPL